MITLKMPRSLCAPSQKNGAQTKIVNGEAVVKLYTPQINKALRIAYNAHHGQFDKSGAPYIFHPAHLAERMDTEEEIIAALLHDVVEDTPVTFADLAAEGFSSAVLDALELLTHDPATPYLDYVRQIKTNALAKKVKLADLAHNSDASRFDEPDAYMVKRWETKYSAALKILNED
jgi:(p)ppGpp synthase/HD superfamily hydrolase